LIDWANIFIQHTREARVLVMGFGLEQTITIKGEGITENMMRSWRMDEINVLSIK
jgi:hypothetical protein